jgi:hypothetical protein
MNPILLPLLAGGVVLYFFSKKQAGANIKVYFKGIKTTGSALSPKFYLTFRIVNVSSFGVTINAIAGEVFVNNKLVGDVNNVETFTVPKTSEIDYSVKFEPNSINVIKTLYQFFLLHQKMEIMFKGTINTTGALIPVEQKVKL